MAAALPVEGRVLARLGWAGQTTDFFEHSLPLMQAGLPGASMGHEPEIFNRPNFPCLIPGGSCQREVTLRPLT